MKKLFVIIFFFILLPCLALAEFQLNGYYENDLIGVAKRTGGGIVGDVNTLRLRIDWPVQETINLHLEPEYDLLIASETLPLTNTQGLDQLVWDRAYAKFYLPQADITLGKQLIAWGTGYIWNPTDVLNPFTLSFAVEEEDKQDVIATRCEVPLGPAEGIDAYIVGGEEWVNTTKGIKAKMNLSDYDLSVSYVSEGTSSWQVGFDLAGELLGLGVRSEVALISPTNVNRYFKSVWGANYTFENGWLVDVEYFFNGAGNKDKANYDWTNYLAGNINQLGMDYYYLGANKMLDEITNLKFSLLFNADDLSHIFYPSYSRNVAQNLDWSFEAMLTGGEPGSEYKPTDAIDPSGFIGSNIIFNRLRYSF